MRIHLPVPREFSFELCFQFLQRSPRELLHRADSGRVTKLLRVGTGLALFSITEGKGRLVIEFHKEPSKEAKEVVRKYVREWFDLDTNLLPFYSLARKDKLLRPLARKFSGYRIIGQPDLYESLIWAVLGQQINLAFAYTLKGRFVEKFGERVEFEGNQYFIFPDAETVSKLHPGQLLALQFSRQKAEYTIGIAKAFYEGTISKEKIAALPLPEAKESLMKVKGIGNWTANYALMKTFRHSDAFPLEDAGLHNAIKNQLKLKAKPTLAMVKKIFKNYKGWEAYATLYLWKSL